MLQKIREKAELLKRKMCAKKLAILTMALTPAMAVKGFCSSEVASSSTYFDVTAATVEPVTTAISSGLTTLIPIGIGIMATFIAIALIKRVIYSFL